MNVVDEKFDLIRTAFVSGRPAQAYLLTGSLRGGAYELALRVARYLFCKAEDKPCGICASCRQIGERVWPDVHWFFPEKKSRIIGVDQMRERIIPAMTQSSLAGGWKIGILMGADRLNPSAANAFLKTLEEPAPETLFLLVSDAPQGLLPTIVSRCQRVDVDDARVLPEPWRSQVLEVLSGNQLGGALEHLAAGLRLDAVLKEMKAAAAKEVDAEIAAAGDQVDEDDEVYDARVSARYREYRAAFLMVLHQWFRDLLVVRAGGSPELVGAVAQREVIVERARRLSLAQALGNVDLIGQIAFQFECNIPESSVLPYWMDRLSHGVAPVKK